MLERHEPFQAGEAAWFNDRKGEECGVFGIYAPNHDVARLVYSGLMLLQHRGEEAAGIAVASQEEGTITVSKNPGLVAEVFPSSSSLSGLGTGDVATGHVRYGTFQSGATGKDQFMAAQPMFYSTPEGFKFTVSQNGHLTNTYDLINQYGLNFGPSYTDGDVLTAVIGAHLDKTGGDLPEALTEALPRLEGAFSLVIMDKDHLIGARDPHGFRPLMLGVLGENEDQGWVLASETPAIDIIKNQTGGRFVREVDAGEIVVMNSENGMSSLRPFAETDPRLCLFEFVYNARPDGTLYGENMLLARRRMGEFLAKQAPADADLVIGAPDSGLPAAEGFSRASGIPFSQFALTKNRYIGRTFIQPHSREQKVRMKLNPVKEEIAGQRLVVIDDSIVRGNTTRVLVEMLRESGAAEVHLRISSPPYKWPCFYGMDTGRQEELIASKFEVDKIRRHVGADSLAYLELSSLLKATNAADKGFCTACFTGEYPTKIPIELTKEPGNT